MVCIHILYICTVHTAGPRYRDRNSKIHNPKILKKKNKLFKS